LNSFYSEEGLISAEEKLGILDSLDKEFFDPTIRLKENIVFKSRKKGILLPLTIWIFSIMISITVLFTLTKMDLSQNPEKEQQSSSANKIGNSILSTYRVEVEETISRKTEQIEVFQLKIDDYDSKLRYLQDLMNKNVHKDRLNELPLYSIYKDFSEEEIKAEISKIEEEKVTVNLQIEETRKEIEEVESDDPFEEFARYQQMLNQESLVTNQISSFYSLILGNLNSFENEKARINLQSLSTLINSQYNNNFPAIQNRKPIDQKIINFLRTYINTIETSQEEENIIALLASKSESYVQNGDELVQQGQKEEAARFYLQSLEFLPFISRALEQLEKIDKEQRPQESEQIIAVSTEDYDQGNMEDSRSDAIIEDNINLETSPIRKENQTSVESDSILIGVIASVKGNSFTVETFKEYQLDLGTELSIRRHSPAGKADIIASGRISSISENVISGKIIELSGDYEILPAQDLVYIEEL